MHRTLFNTPVLKYFLRGLSLFLLKIFGWKTVGQLPAESKYVLIFAWHTSNWDLFYGMLMVFCVEAGSHLFGEKRIVSLALRPAYEMARQRTYRKEGVSPYC
jgi:hypothetical protein